MTEILSRALLADERALAAIDLIWTEAAILDDKNYQEWDALWDEDPDVRYVIPISASTDDFDSVLNMVNDDARMRRMRIERLSSGYSMSALAAARTVRTVSRFRLIESRGDRITLSSVQILVGFKRDTQSVLAADLTHTIRFTESGPKLFTKVVRLVNSEGPVSASGYLL